MNENGNSNGNKITYYSTTNVSNFEGFPINVGNDGQFLCYDMMLKRVYDLMMGMISRHNKILFIRFDLRFPNDYAPEHSNNAVSLLFKTFKEYYNYYGIDVQFAWFREQSKEKHQHYHCIVLMNGNKVLKYFPVLQYISEVWGRILQCDPNGLVDYCEWDRDGNPAQNGIMIRRPSSKALGEDLERQKQQFQKDFGRCFFWASYLCKENQKSNIPFRKKRYGTSQMKNPSGFVSIV